MKKKFLTTLLSLTMVFLLVACGGDTAQGGQDDGTAGENVLTMATMCGRTVVWSFSLLLQMMASTII